MAEGYTPLRVPFANISFTPDVPSNALAANEYNAGYNIEADVRGVKKVDGEAPILSAISGNIIYMEAGFRSNNDWCYIVATSAGVWYKVNIAGISVITPPSPYVTYSTTTGYSYSGSISGSPAPTPPITGAWIGQVFFINDNINPPMYLLPSPSTAIALFDSVDPVTLTTNIWNYEITVGVASVQAAFVREYSAPNIGNILIAGNLTKTATSGGAITHYPTTVRWSQTFANTGVPHTWQPTLTNTANELEVPVRGPLIDGFPLGANFYVCSYWDTVIFAPIAYQSQTAPVFAIAPFKKGRGLLNQNCWDNGDDVVYGVDARDIWAFDGSQFVSLANQKLKNYFYSNLNPNYISAVHVVNNTKKNQVEIYYPSLNSTGYCDQMLSWRYDLKVWNAPKTINNSAMAVEAPVYNTTTSTFNLSSRCTVYAPNTGAGGLQLIQTGQGTSFSGNAINCLFERDNLTLLDGEGNPISYPHRLYVHRLFPEISTTTPSNAPYIYITLGGANSTAQTPTFGDTEQCHIVTNDPWVTTTQNDVRTVALKFGTNDATNTWNMTAMTFLSTIVEDAF
jgi:hypothetical protein